LANGWKKVEKLTDSEGSPLWIEHPKLGSDVDIILLPLSSLDEVAIHPYDVNYYEKEIDVGPADAVSVVGFPFGKTGGRYFAIWATGFMASEPEFDLDGQPKFLIDCRSRPGQSGSAVIALP